MQIIFKFRLQTWKDLRFSCQETACIYFFIVSAESLSTIDFELRTFRVAQMYAFTLIKRAWNALER